MSSTPTRALIVQQEPLTFTAEQSGDPAVWRGLPSAWSSSQSLLVTYADTLSNSGAANRTVKVWVDQGAGSDEVYIGLVSQANPARVARLPWPLAEGYRIRAEAVGGQDPAITVEAVTSRVY